MLTTLYAEQRKQTQGWRYYLSWWTTNNLKTYHPIDELYDQLNLKFRRAKFSDIDKLHDLERTAYLKVAERFSKEQIEIWLEKAPTTFFVVESVDSEIIGYALYVEFDETASDAEVRFDDGVKTAEIVSLATHRYYEGIGIGTTLLELLEDLALKNFCKRIILEVNIENRLAIRLYEKHGYSRVKEIKNYYAVGDAAYVMEKLIDSANMNKLLE